MKKLVAAFVTAGILFSGTAAMNVSAKEYQVQERDTLWGIAQDFNTSVQHLVDINNLDSFVIQPGQKIHTGEEKPVIITYTVKKGDTLSDISKKFHVTVEDIKDWNELTSTLVIAGQELEIKVNNAEEVKDATIRSEER